MKLFVRFRKLVKPKPWVVQLHRAHSPRWREGDRTSVILNSWAPIECANEADALRQAGRLRQDNQWGGIDSYPYVTITNPDGERYP